MTRNRQQLTHGLYQIGRMATERIARFHRLQFPRFSRFWHALVQIARRWNLLIQQNQVQTAALAPWLRMLALSHRVSFICLGLATVICTAGCQVLYVPAERNHPENRHQMRFSRDLILHSPVYDLSSEVVDSPALCGECGANHCCVMDPCGEYVRGPCLTPRLPGWLAKWHARHKLPQPPDHPRFQPLPTRPMFSPRQGWTVSVDAVHHANSPTVGLDAPGGAMLDGGVGHQPYGHWPAAEDGGLNAAAGMNATEY